MIDELDMAIYNTVHDYRDGVRVGAVALAPKVGMNAGTLSNKANPGMETHQLGMRESIPIQLQSNDFQIVRSYSATLGGVFLRLPSLEGVSNVELLTAWARMDAARGETATEYMKALEDQRITADEVRLVKRKVLDDIVAALELFRRLVSVCDEPLDDFMKMLDLSGEGNE